MTRTFTAQPKTATLSEDDAILRIKCAMEQCLELTRQGLIYRLMRYGRRNQHLAEKYDESRADLLSERGIQEFLRARSYLENFSIRKTINTSRTSYGLKHGAENYHNRNYVSNGALIAAAIDLGFKIKPLDEYSLNCYLSIGRGIDNGENDA